MVAASAPLVEPGSPPWAGRFALRLQQLFWPTFPTQPMRVWDAGSVADLPPAADWPDCVAIAGGEFWVSNGTARVQPQMDAPTPPQFDNDNSLATTAWVNRVGHQFSSRMVVSANTVLNATAAGALVIINTAGVTVTLPPAAPFPSGTTISFTVQAGPVAVKAAGADVINMGAGLPTTVTMNAADTLDLVSNGANSWPVYGGSAQLAYGSNFALPPLFDTTGKLATAAFVQRALGNDAWGYAFNANTVLNNGHLGAFIVCFSPMTTLTLPVSTGFNPGVTLDILAATALTVVAQGADTIHTGLASASTYAMAAGARRRVTYGYTNQWFAGS